ncbi:FKBP-type peptidyl-prolyl cis-trans isomerase [Kitasatospora cheerisanensis]|uniref:peptidylprolyl isomerase n=1 Tax=Kitasatospora cheerisanensis KCTC 2395 TaxID=1348663 RepID=A0A066YJ63_9ACTN|nr:FKBP-type peptidyl-prolyl cis-trans isomerase [Kitasatospora cheerisanensis]KDN81538.1 putative peptidyl-prolyl cis-trans isomerase FKBP-type [Kitasatospora cheerisanensis KCTC 2395]
MSEKTSGPDEAGKTGQQRPGDRESIVVPAELLTQAGWAAPSESVKGSGEKDDEAPQVFASTQRKVDLSEAGYDEDPGSSGRLGAILGTVLAVLLIGSAVTMYVVNKDDNKPAAKSDAAKPAATDTPSQEPVPPIKDNAKALPTVTGDFGSKATITVPQDKPDGTFVVKELSAGTGAKVEKGNWVSVDYTAMDWNTGKEIPGSYGEQNGKPQLYQADAGKLIPALDKAVTGHKAGSRLLVVAPPGAAFGAQGNTQLGVGATDSLVFVLDIRQSTAPDAVLSGEMTAPPAGMPQVKDNGKKPFDITPVPGAADPTELKSHVLIQGKGRKVESGEKVVVQYTGALYKDGKKFDSSLDRGQAFTFATGAGSVIEGWDKGVVGQNIGSRIELVIPASLAYKDQASGSIPANSTLVFVIDILDAGVGGED